MRVLHVLDHSMPLMSGYSTRSRNVVVFQREAGLSPIVRFMRMSECLSCHRQNRASTDCLTCHK